jgi:hypothetical protein
MSLDEHSMLTLKNRIRTVLLFRFDLHDQIAEPHDNIVIQTLSLPQLDALSEINPNVNRDLEIEKLNAGQTCYVARFNGALAHYSWIQDSGQHLIKGAGRKWPAGNGNLWINSCYTAEWARGNCIYPTVLRQIMQDYFTRGFNTAWIYTLESNVASVKGISAAGFELVERLKALSVRALEIPLPGLRPSTHDLFKHHGKAA